MIDRVVDKAVTLNVIKAEEKEVYAYMYTQLLTTVVTWGGALVLAWGLGRIVEIIMFLGTFITLRHYTGGLHAQSRLACGITTILMVTLLAVLSRFELFFTVMNIAAYGLGIAILIVFLLAPMEDKNKPLSHTERIFFRKMSRIIIVVESMLIAVFYALGILTDYLVFAVLGVYLTTFLLLIKRISVNNRCERDDKYDKTTE